MATDFYANHVMVAGLRAYFLLRLHFLCTGASAAPGEEPAAFHQSFAAVMRECRRIHLRSGQPLPWRQVSDLVRAQVTRMDRVPERRP